MKQECVNEEEFEQRVWKERGHLGVYNLNLLDYFGDLRPL